LRATTESHTFSFSSVSPVNDTNLIERIDTWTQAAMDCEDFVFDDCRQTQINLGDLSALVIASNQGDPIGVPDLECQKQQEGFNTVISPIDKVSQKEIILVGAFSSHFEKFHQVIKLSMNVSAYL
jgi:hypothetical protein